MEQHEMQETSTDQAGMGQGATAITLSEMIWSTSSMEEVPSAKETHCPLAQAGRLPSRCPMYMRWVELKPDFRGFR
jgi:hypothetical protein